MKKKTAATALVEVAFAPRSGKARAKRWMVTFVNRPIHEDDEFMTENEVWVRTSSMCRTLLVEKVEPKK